MLTPRERALDILMRIQREGVFAAPLIEPLKVEDRDRRFIRHLVFAVLRWRSLLDSIIERIASRRLNTLDALTLEILRLGFAQLLYTDIGPHAVVNESVELAGRRAPRAKGLVNAVMRKASAANLRAMTPKGDSAAAIAIRHGHPEWMLQRWIDFYGLERAEAIARANQELSFADLFVNVQKRSVDEIAAVLKERNIPHERSLLLAESIRLRQSTVELEDLIENGEVHVMDEGSALVASAISDDVKQVLDLTAAPGGKSLVLLARGKKVVSNDLSLPRLKMLREVLPRMFGHAGRVVVGDALRAPFGGRFEAVLLDAPCSATGTIRRNPELKWRITQESIGEVAALQKELLHRALDLSEVECVYSTCSLEREENDDVVAAVLSERDDFHLAPLDSLDAGVRRFLDGPVLRLTPEGGTDGFIVHKLIRNQN